MSSAYFAYAVFDIEKWSTRPAVLQQRMVAALNQIVSDCLGQLGVDDGSERRTGRGDGLILALPGGLPKEQVTELIATKLPRRLAQHNRSVPSAEAMRLRVALHAGDALQDQQGQWAGAAVVEACRLVEAEVLRRVLAAARGSAVAILISDAWYKSVISEGFYSDAGWCKVQVSLKNFDAAAWIAVPGLSSPPGLTADDVRAGAGYAPTTSDTDPRAEQESGGARSAITFNERVEVAGDVVAGDKVNYLNLGEK